MTYPNQKTPYSKRLDIKTARFEYKYVAKERDEYDIEHWITSHPAGFREVHEPRQVNNVYFDTIDFDAYSENLSGVSARQKYRLRWYGDHTQPRSPALELKLKRNKYGWKFSYPLDELPHFKSTSWTEIKNTIIQQLPESEVSAFEPLVAILMNHYDRRYFCSWDDKIRLTVDLHHAVYDQRLMTTPNGASPSNSPSPLVLELKFHPQDRLLCTEITKDIPLRQSRHSKYAVGANSILS
ncbi:MAG: VTC domain-containing protein [Pseudomonadales bacterium]|nr:VTC domain-containing protein [Pseudomonadales bacterium]